MRHLTLLATWLLSFSLTAQNICDGLNAGFTWGAATGVGGAQFANTTTGTGQQTIWQWSFGDGTTSTEAQPFHVFPGPGTYEVCLTAITIFITPNGASITCVDEFCAPVAVGGVNNCAWLNANFTWASGVNGVEFHYQPPTPGAQYTYLWSFGDGTTASTQNAFHAYAANGNFEVCLTVTAYVSSTNVSCTATTCQAVNWSGSGGNICDGLNAGFTPITTSGASGVQFSNTTTGTGQQTTWQWDFGDGATSTEAQPFHVFPGPGTYEVCLTAITIFITNAGVATTCVDEFCAPVVVAGVNNCSWLNADFTWASGANGVEFHYQPSGPAAVQYTYLWSFGDGTTATTQNAFHSYTANGTFEVCLTVTAIMSNSTTPCTATTCQAVTWIGGNVCDGLNAGFTSAATSASGGVQFSNTTTGTGQQTTWQWDFGDGTTSTEAQPFHVFPGPGTYEVCLTAITIFITPNGASITCVDEFCAPVVVGGVNNCAWLNANFTWASGVNGVEFHYQPPTPGAQYTYLWSFGDGTTASTQNAFHAYAANGTFEVCLTVTAYVSSTNVSCTATTCQVVNWNGSGGNVCDGLNAGFTAIAISAAGGVQFSNTTTGTGQQTTWSWSFGDGTASTEAQPFHVFPGPGTYEVCLTAITVFLSPNSPALTCVDVFCAPVTIGNVEPIECDPSFALEIESEPANAGFVLHATTNLPNDGISWVFSNGLVLFGPSIQVGALSDLNLELCIYAWYLPSSTSDTCWATVCGTLGQLGFAVGVSELDAATISVYPNPTQAALFISGVPTGSVRARVYAADGRLELEAQGTDAPMRLNLEGLAPGLKWVRVQADGREHHFKVVKE